MTHDHRALPLSTMAREGSVTVFQNSKSILSSAVEPAGSTVPIPTIHDVPNRSNKQLRTKIENLPIASTRAVGFFLFLPQLEPFDDRWNRNRKLSPEKKGAV